MLSPTSFKLAADTTKVELHDQALQLRTVSRELVLRFRKDSLTKLEKYGSDLLQNVGRLAKLEVIEVVLVAETPRFYAEEGFDRFSIPLFRDRELDQR